MPYDVNANQLVVAMDHARYYGVIEGLEDPGRVIDTVVDAGADAIMTSFGVIKKYRDRLVGRVPTLMRLDGGSSLYSEGWRTATQWSLLHTVEDARAMGVDGVCLMYFMGSPVDLETLDIVSAVVSDCLADGFPVMVEALPCPCEKLPDPDTPKPMADACRIAFEHGADVVKTYYTGSPDGFRTVIENCPAPVLIAGGPRMATQRDVIDVVHGAVSVGAKGVVFGRNLWQSRHPDRIIGALRRVIHDGASADEAAELLEG